MNNAVTLYAIIRTESGDAYVGSTVSKKDRWTRHRYDLRRGAHHCSHLQRAWAKYGERAFEFTVLETAACAGREERLVAETAWIAAIGTYNVLVSADRAGQFVVRPEARAQRSATAKAKIIADPAYAAFLAERGQAIAALARSPEGREIMRSATLRRWADPAEREKLAQGLRNRWADPSARERQAEKTGARMRTVDAARSHSEKLKAAWRDPEKAARLRSRVDARWTDPEAKARQSASMKAIWADRRAKKADAT